MSRIPREGSAERLTIGISLLAGLVFTVAVTLLANSAGYPVYRFDSLATLYVSVLLGTVGVLASYFALRFRLVTPIPVLAGATLLWWRSEGATHPGDPFVGFIGVLPVWMLVLVVIGAGEYRAREYWN